MPRYQYECKNKCGDSYTAIQTMAEYESEPAPECEACEIPMVRVYGGKDIAIWVTIR